MARFDLWRATPVIGAALLVLAAALPARDTKVGAVWEITRTLPDGKVLTGKFWALPDGKVVNRAGKEIGKHVGNDAEFTMTITDAEPSVCGTYKLMRFNKNPPSGRGTFTNAKGESFPVKVRLVKD